MSIFSRPCMGAEIGFGRSIDFTLINCVLYAVPWKTKQKRKWKFRWLRLFTATQLFERSLSESLIHLLGSKQARFAPHLRLICKHRKVCFGGGLSGLNLWEPLNWGFVLPDLEFPTKAAFQSNNLAHIELYLWRSASLWVTTNGIALSL